MGDNAFSEFADKMRAAGCSEAAVRAFEVSFRQLASGRTGLVPETDIEPVERLPQLTDIPGAFQDSGALLGRAAVIKLNGGLGTSMGLEQPKSLLPVTKGLTFLDFIVRQILHMRQKHGALRFLLMNSFSTSPDTSKFLENYPELGKPAELELMQNQVPKVDAETLCPVTWPENPTLEWCPPGHGDIFPSLLGSGWLDRFEKAGVNFLFISNSDNLGATLDLPLLGYFAGSGLSFLMEVAERTASDRKGGHLARSGGRLILRESAQCPEADMVAFQDTTKHRFFNTNNLWIRVDRLRQVLAQNRGVIPLPMIRNIKTVDPRVKTSKKVYQLETAMGAAVGCFDDAGAIVVPRTRFAPVKTTGDLLALRSDAYRVTPDWRLVLDTESGTPPSLDLDNEHYKLLDQLDAHTPAGPPSLKRCRELRIRGPLRLGPQHVFCGRVSLVNRSPQAHELPAGSYQDQEVVF